MSPPAQGPSPEEPIAPAPEGPQAGQAPQAPRTTGAADPVPLAMPAREGEASERPDAGDEEVDGPTSGGADDDKRRYPSTIGGAFYLVVLAVTVAGLVIASTGNWRTGVHCMAGAVMAAAVLRFLLPQKDAGMLAVRARWIDVTLLGSLGVLLWVLASNTPNG